MWRSTPCVAPLISGSVTDISNPEAVKRLFDDVRTQLGGPDILVNNAGLSGRTAQEEIDGALQNQAIKRFINPDDIAELVKFLCGKHARTISGQSFPIDGDSKATQ